MRIIHEIHRRSLWQVLGIYVAGSWVALQVVNEVVDSVALPEWVSGAAVVLLVIGFPIVLATAFVQEGVGGEKREEAPANPASTGEGAVPGTRPASPADPPAADIRASSRGAHRRVLTWRNAVVGGVGAFAVLGLATAAFVFMRTAGIGPAATLVAQGVLEARDRILLADFTNRTDDELLAGVVTEALRVDLAQSESVRLAEQSMISGALTRMERPTDTPIDATLARLLAQREGVKAVLTGEIGQVGSSYSLTAQVVEPADGTVLFSHRETADGADGIIDAINRLSRRLRERIGEPLGSLRATPPLERVTTSDLEALRLYTQAVRAIEFDADDERGIALLEEAIAIDTAFAAAYRKLGVTLGNRFEQRDRRIEALIRAYNHRDRLTSSERYMTIASYNTDVTGDVQAAVTAYENLLESDPTYYPALNNLGIVQFQLRNFERAEELYLRAATAERSSPFPWLNAVWPQVQLGRFDAADASLDSVATAFPGYATVDEYRGKLRVLEGEYDAAIDEWTGLLERRTGDPFYESLVHELIAMVEAAHGRFEEAERRLALAEDADRRRGLPGAALEHALTLAWGDLIVFGDTAAALSRVESVLARESVETLPAADRPYLELGDLYAQAGRLAPAREFLAAFESSVPADQRGRGVANDYLRSQAAIATAEGRTDEALDLIRRSDRGGCIPCVHPYFADAYERAGMADSAIAVYEDYVDMTWVDRVYWDATDRARYLERLGQLYDEKGDLPKAAEYYARFVELWADADPPLQPRVRAADERLQAIMQEIG
ncbi:MAG: tetratricopeptide repeat protein [Gemmatimonadota bacterium]|nr:tetratricopeptide repeat protein [Gemmatimonadota bacterium]